MTTALMHMHMKIRHIGRAYASHRAAKITVIVKGQFARQDETVSSRLKFVSLAFNS